jgi:hypothetical protein
VSWRVRTRCGTSRAIDLHTIDHQPLASVGTLVPGLRCSSRLLGFYALPTASAGFRDEGAMTKGEKHGHSLR